MPRPRGTFSKRDRETKLKERAAAKAARRAAKRLEVRVDKGPPNEEPTAPEIIDVAPPADVKAD